MEGFYGRDIERWKGHLWLMSLQFQKLQPEFEMQGINEEKLHTQQWQSVEQRMATEEASCELSATDHDDAA